MSVETVFKSTPAFCVVERVNDGKDDCDSGFGRSGYLAGSTLWSLQQYLLLQLRSPNPAAPPVLQKVDDWWTT